MRSRSVDLASLGSSRENRGFKTNKYTYVDVCTIYFIYLYILIKHYKIICIYIHKNNHKKYAGALYCESSIETIITWWKATLFTYFFYDIPESACFTSIRLFQQVETMSKCWSCCNLSDAVNKLSLFQSI